jgi:hypothetical protein
VFTGRAAASLAVRRGAEVARPLDVTGLVGDDDWSPLEVEGVVDAVADPEAPTGPGRAGTSTCWTRERLPSLPTSSPPFPGATARVSPCGWRGSSVDESSVKVRGSSRWSEV